MGKGSRSVSWLVSSCVDKQAKTAPTSSLVAVYWRVEEVVERPVAGSSFMLWVITTTTAEGKDSEDDNNIHILTQIWVTNIFRAACVAFGDSWKNTVTEQFSLGCVHCINDPGVETKVKMQYHVNASFLEMKNSARHTLFCLLLKLLSWVNIVHSGISFPFPLYKNTCPQGDLHLTASCVVQLFLGVSANVMFYLFHLQPRARHSFSMWL